MNNMKVTKFLNIASITLESIVFVLALVLIFMSNIKSSSQEVKLKHLGFQGTYSVDGVDYDIYNENDHFDFTGKKIIIFKGRFTSDIEKNENIMLYIYNLRITIKINNEVVYKYGFERLSPYTKSTGASWHFYKTEGISRDDEIEITLENIYSQASSQYIEDFLKNLYYGSGYELYQEMLNQNSTSIMLGYLILIFGFIELIVCSISLIVKVPKASLGISLSVLTIIGGFYFLFDRNFYYIHLLFTNSLIAHMLDIIPLFLIPINISMVVQSIGINSSKAKFASRSMTIVISCYIILLLLLQIFGLKDLYELQSYVFYLGLFEIIAIFSLLLPDIIKNKNKNALMVLLIFIPLIIGAVVDIINYTYLFIPIRVTFNVGYMISLFIQLLYVFRLIYVETMKMKRTAKLEYELLQSKISIMVSQIQPHFMFNTLTVIKHLCMEDIEKARDAIDYFSAFLRRNIDSLSTTIPVPFEQELYHIDCYLKLEKLRLEDRLEVVYDIKEMDFRIPTLSVQPLVENAIRYGISKKREGGTLRLSTYADKNNYVVEVEDDGMGFDINDIKTKNFGHIGIENVRNRMQIVGGSLFIDSKINIGTVAKLIIPKTE